MNLLEAVKERIKSSQHHVAMYVNSELLFTYWHIGDHLNLETQRQSWGSKVVDQLAQDLKANFPKMKGLSKRNLQYMMKFATHWPLDEFVQQAAAQIEIHPDNELPESASTKISSSTARIHGIDSQYHIISQQAMHNLR